VKESSGKRDNGCFARSRLQVLVNKIDALSGPEQRKLTKKLEEELNALLPQVSQAPNHPKNLGLCFNAGGSWWDRSTICHVVKLEF
jgi:hypothetical protein